MLNKILTLPYPRIKLLILFLLSVDILIFALVDSLLSAADALAWVGLLILYEFIADEHLIKLSLSIQQTLRHLLIGVVILVFFGYVYYQAWLDIINGLLWFMLVIMLELEIRYPDQVAKRQTLFKQITIGVFAGLIIMVLVWLSQSAWLDAYDAALWIAAFAFIEEDIFHFLQPLQKNSLSD